MEDLIDVSCLMVGIDDRARAAVQGTMNEIAETGDSGSDEGLVAMLGRALRVLTGASESWTHAAAVNASPRPGPAAEAHFRALTLRARARFEDELIRNVDGRLVRDAAPALPDTGVPGVVVVTLVVAATVELLDVGDARDRGDVERLIERLGRLRPDEFVAMEVIWSPADDADRATAAMVEAKYPELQRLGGSE